MMSSLSRDRGAALRANSTDVELLHEHTYYHLDTAPLLLHVSPAQSPTTLVRPAARSFISRIPLYGQGRAIGQAIQRELEALEEMDRASLTQEDEEVMWILLVWLAVLFGIMIFVAILSFVYGMSEV